MRGPLWCQRQVATARLGTVRPDWPQRRGIAGRSGFKSHVHVPVYRPQIIWCKSSGRCTLPMVLQTQLRLLLERCTEAGVHAHLVCKAFQAHDSPHSKAAEEVLKTLVRELYAAEQHARRHFECGGSCHERDPTVKRVRQCLGTYAAELKTARQMARMIHMKFPAKDRVGGALRSSTLGALRGL